MKLTQININSPVNFGAKSKEIRDADKITRQIKHNFPLFSATYGGDFYLSAKENSPNAEKSRATLNGVHKEIQRAREYFAAIGHIYSNPNRKIFSTLKRIKKGNCQENAELALAHMYANGFYDTDLCHLNFKAVVLDKNTGEYITAYNKEADHAFILTNMNKHSKKDIVIDPWLGFADSISGAVSRFKKIYDEEDFDELISFLKEHIKTYEEEGKSSENFDKDYVIKKSFSIKKSNVADCSNVNKKRLGEDLLMVCPEAKFEID